MRKRTNEQATGAEINAIIMGAVQKATSEKAAVETEHLSWAANQFSRLHKTVNKVGY